MALLERFLPSVIAAAENYHRLGAQAEIIVVDDNSSDGTTAWLLNQGFKPSGSTRRLIRNQSNLGFAISCNRGARAAQKELLLLVNNDVEVEPDAIAPLAEHFLDPSVFAVHPSVFELGSGRQCGMGQLGSFGRGFLRVHSGYMPEPGSRPYSIFASGGSALFDRKKFLQLGGFDPLFAPFYWEDVELSYRAWKRGYLILYEPRSIVRHQISSTIGKLDPGRVRRIRERNRLMLHWIHLHDRRMLLEHVIYLVALFLLRPWFIGSLVDALKLFPEIRRRRHREKLAAKRTDRQVMEFFISARPRS
jgi:GT2 family glycosyltransferase